MIWLSYTIVVCWNNNKNNEELQGCMGQMSILVYPLHWGKHPKGRGCEPPICCVMLYILPVLTQHLYMKPCSCLPVPNSSTTSLPLTESMGTCFTEGGMCDKQGIWVIQGLLPLGSTLDMSTLVSTTWSTQVSEYPREY